MRPAASPIKDTHAKYYVALRLSLGRPVGMVTAAPYGGDWFHAHFGISKEPLRLIGWYGPNNHRKDKKPVPVPAILRTAKRLEPPSLDEGFDEIQTITPTPEPSPKKSE